MALLCLLEELKRSVLILFSPSFYGVSCQVSNKRWKVEVNSKKDAELMLSAVNLPGGIQVCNSTLQF